MKTTVSVVIASLALAAGALAAPAKKLQLKDLLPPVQATIREQSKEIRNISSETEDGIAQYEVETVLNGKHRDFNVDTKGALLVVEEETTLDATPPAAKAVILKKTAGGKLGMIELFKRGSEALYEAAYTGRDGKKHSVLLKADGSETKD